MLRQTRNITPLTQTRRRLARIYKDNTHLTIVCSVPLPMFRAKASCNVENLCRQSRASAKVSLFPDSRLASPFSRFTHHFSPRDRHVCEDYGVLKCHSQTVRLLTHALTDQLPCVDWGAWGAEQCWKRTSGSGLRILFFGLQRASTVCEAKTIPHTTITTSTTQSTNSSITAPLYKTFLFL